MTTQIDVPRNEAPLGTIEPHAAMLRQPSEEQDLFKIMAAEHLLCSVRESYIHFSRIDAYSDFPGADPHDGEQLLEDRTGNQQSKFESQPGFSAADYFDMFRSRTYASCFSLDDSSHIWNAYGMGGSKGKVGLVFRFGPLRARLNETLAAESTTVMIGDAQVRQIFSINYGVVEYVDWQKHKANAVRLPNPLSYVYLKDQRYSPERELRVSLSTLGIGQFAMRGEVFAFPKMLQLAFDYKRAFTEGTLELIIDTSHCDMEFLRIEMEKLGISLASGDVPVRSTFRG